MRAILCSCGGNFHPPPPPPTIGLGKGRKGFDYCLTSKRRKGTKREYKEKDKTILHVSCCTFVLLQHSFQRKQGERVTAGEKSPRLQAHSQTKKRCRSDCESPIENRTLSENMFLGCTPRGSCNNTRVFWKRGRFRKDHCLEVLENLAFPAAIYRSAQWPGPESAPRSAF